MVFINSLVTDILQSIFHSQKKGTKAVTGAVPFQKVSGANMYILSVNMYILGANLHISGGNMYILSANMYIKC